MRRELPGKPPLPIDIPVTPYRIYKDKGWKDFGDWLGTGTIAPQLRGYRPFKEARAFAHNLDLKGQAEWFKYCKGELPGKLPLPMDIPTNPNKTYKDKGWKDFGDWLGTGTIAPVFRKFRPFKEARAFANSLDLKSSTEWWKYCTGKLVRKPPIPMDIPKNPNITYKDNGWKGMGRLAWNGGHCSTFKGISSFQRSPGLPQSLNLKSGTEWRKYCQGQLKGKPKLPMDIPVKPYRTYKDKGWKGMGDWLGTGTIASQLREYRPFKKARALAHSLHLKSSTEWRKYCQGQLKGKPKLPMDIPKNLYQTYKNKGWKGMGDWLGTGTVATNLREYRSFQEARAFVHSLHLNNQAEWRKYCKRQLPEKPPLPGDIPLYPEGVYKDKGWKGMGDWLGKKI